MVNPNHLKIADPFRELKRFNDVNYTIVSLGNHKIQNIHYNRLRKYRARENLGAPILNTNSGSSTSRQSRPVSNDINLDLVLFSQLLLGVRSSSPVVGNSGDSSDSSDTDDDLTVNSVEEDVDAGDEHEIENERNSDDGNEEENRDQSLVERKQACPVCQKKFLSVNIHIGKSKNDPHMQYKQERNDELIDALNSTL